MKIFDKTPKPGSPIRLRMFFLAIVRMARAWETLAVSNGHVDWSNGTPTIVLDAPNEGAAGVGGYSDWAFGYSIVGDVVTVNAGKIRHGTRAAISVSGDDITIASDQTYIWVEYPYGTGAATLESGTSEPTDDAETHRRLLYVVTLSEGAAIIGTGGIRHMGDIFIPGALG